MHLLVANSDGSAEPDNALVEFNPCHDIGNGRFAVKGQGRCLGDTARRGAREEYERLDRTIQSARDERDLEDSINRLNAQFGDNPAQNAAYRQGWDARMAHSRRQEVRQLAADRRGARRYERENPPPSYMRPDIARAWKTDRVTVAYSPKRSGPDESPGTANLPNRTVLLQPSDPSRRFHTKSEQLSALRHELGHIDRTPLGRGADRVAGTRFSDRYTEEIRAWKNAIRNSKGRVDWNTVRDGLESYLLGEYMVQGYPPKASAIADRHVGLLKRYAKRIRRASKGLD